MSLFRQTSKWALRGLVLWALFETGSALYDDSVQTWTAVARLKGHNAAMHRLEERARNSEAQAQDRETELARHLGVAWQVRVEGSESLGAAAARALREQLITLGAEAPVVDASETQSGADQSLTARWREPVETAPFVLIGLAQRLPQLRIVQLTMQRQDRIVTEAQFQTTARAAPPAQAAPMPSRGAPQ